MLDCPPGNLRSSVLMTSVDSAFLGSAASVRSSVTSASLPPSGVSAAASTTHATSTSHLVRRPVRKVASLLGTGPSLHKSAGRRNDGAVVAALGAGPEPLGDVAGEAVNGLPVPKVPSGSPDGVDHRPLAKAQVLPGELAGEQAVLHRAGALDHLLHVEGGLPRAAAREGARAGPS